MAVEPFLLKKALDISLPAIGKSVSVVIKGLVVLLLVAGIAWSVYVTMIRPHTKPKPTTDQHADTIDNQTVQAPKVTFGCMNLNLKPDK